ncbi:MAG: DUF1223 domain-containing protein [Gammaproteobacteria bacterium]|nr:DUF1223 domain-containing protein [Gammaproteobacteria bacterium]
MKRLIVSLATTILLVPTAGAAEDVRFSSGPGQTVLVELFTSEGCNSCPPAEAYLNRFVNDPALWKKFIPLAFHVDYWDYLGWKDRFAQPAHAERQRRYAQQRRVSTVYTPAFVVNGQGWRPSWGGGEPVGGGVSVGTLTVDITGQEFEARFDVSPPASNALQLNLAVLGMGLVSEIQAGENAGRRSQHEFVVLAHKQIASDNGRWRDRLPAVDRDQRARRMAVAAWVSRPGDLAPLQATGGYLPVAPR